jgi:aspartate kinase
VPIVVQKYGGSSVAGVERIRRVADRVAATRAAGRDVVVVVSAMGDTTDELLALARQVSANPARRELDMLLTAGERIAMALLALALNDRGVEAVSFTGSQSGIITNDAHTNARIVEVRPFRVEDELSRGKVVIVAGYQGVSYKREVTTLGRGGSDTTAVALAAALGAEACEIYSDVAGVFTADPRVVPAARRLDEISYEEMQELAESGARVLNAQAVEFAKQRGIAIYARASSGSDEETVVRRFPPRTPGRVVGVASESGLVRLELARDFGPLAPLLELLDAQGVEAKQLRHDDTLGTTLLLALENVHGWPALRTELEGRFPALQVREGLGAVSAIGAGINSRFSNVRECLRLLAEEQVAVHALATSRFRVSLLLDEAATERATRLIHRELVERLESAR